MKVRNSFFLLTLCTLLAFTGSLNAQTADYSQNNKREIVEQKAKIALDKMMVFVQKRNYESFGKMMMYSGKDQNRTLRMRMNWRNSHEKLEIENTLNYIRHWLNKSALYHAKNFRVVHGTDDEIYFFDIEFTMIKGKAKIFHASFMRFEGRMCFIRMEKT